MVSHMFLISSELVTGKTSSSYSCTHTPCLCMPFVFSELTSELYTTTSTGWERVDALSGSLMAGLVTLQWYVPEGHK